MKIYTSKCLDIIPNHSSGLAFGYHSQLVIWTGRDWPLGSEISEKHQRSHDAATHSSGLVLSSEIVMRDVWDHGDVFLRLDRSLTQKTRVTLEKTSEPNSPCVLHSVSFKYCQLCIYILFKVIHIYGINTFEYLIKIADVSKNYILYELYILIYIKCIYFVSI